MKKRIKNRLNRGQTSLQLYGCACSCGGCTCSGCGSGSSTDWMNVKEASRIQSRNHTGSTVMSALM